MIHTAYIVTLVGLALTSDIVQLYDIKVVKIEKNNNAHTALFCTFSSKKP